MTIDPRLRRCVQSYNGEWFPVKHRGYLLACCDCGLIHSLDVRLRPVLDEGGQDHGMWQVIVRVYRQPRLTRQYRQLNSRRLVMAGKGPGGKGASNRRPNTRKSNKSLTGTARREESRRMREPGGIQGGRKGRRSGGSGGSGRE